MKKYLIIIIIALIATCYFTILSSISIHKKYSEFETNMYNTLNLADQRITLHSEKQFKNFYPYIDSVVNSLNIKHIETITHINYYYDSDTTIIELIQVSPDIPIFKFSQDTACYKLAGFANFEDKSLMLTELSFNDEITVILHNDRRPLFNINWMPNWGKKIPSITSHSKCGANTPTININIE